MADSRKFVKIPDFPVHYHFGNPNPVRGDDCDDCRATLRRTSRPFPINPDECVRLCEAMAAFWGDGICDAPIWPGAYLTEEDTPIRELVRAAVGWRKP